MILTELYESSHSCPECGGPAFSDLILAETQDACYHKVRSRYKVWPSAYASGALVQCRKKGAANWGNKSESMADPVGESGQGVAEDFGGGGYPKTPNYRVGDRVFVHGYQGVGKIAYIKHRDEVGVIFKEPSHPRVVTAIEKLQPASGVSEGAHWSDEWEPVEDINTKTGQAVGMVMRHSSGTYAYYDNRKSNIESGFSSAEQARQAFVELHNARVRSNNPGVAEGYKFKGGFPFDVDHMPGAVHRNADMVTDNVKTKDKTQWARAVDSINARVFDDMSEFSTDRHGETVTGNGAVWAKWDNATQTGWFNAEGRPLRTWAVKEQGVAEAWLPTYNRKTRRRGGERLTPMSQEEIALERAVRDAMAAKDIKKARQLAYSAKRPRAQEHLHDLIFHLRQPPIDYRHPAQRQTPPSDVKEDANTVLGYMNKAIPARQQAMQTAIRSYDPEVSGKAKATYLKRDQGIARARDRMDKHSKQEFEKRLQADVAALPELKAEYAQMLAQYKSLGGSDWQYADRDQNLTDAERQARGMEHDLNRLADRIQAAERSKTQGVAEGSEEGFSIEDMVMDQYRNGNEVWEIASNLGMSEDEVQDIINDGGQGVAEGSLEDFKNWKKTIAPKAAQSAIQKAVNVRAQKQALAKAITQNDINRALAQKGVTEGKTTNPPGFASYVLANTQGKFSDAAEIEDLFDYAYLSDLDLYTIADGADEEGISALKWMKPRMAWLLKNINDPSYLPVIEPLAAAWMKTVAPAIDKYVKNVLNETGQGVAESTNPQVGDAVYYGTRLVGWFKGYSEHGKIITEPNEEEMGDDYSNRDVYWDPQDKITIKPETAVTEGDNSMAGVKWRVEQGVLGRYRVVKGYSTSTQTWKNKFGASDFNNKSDAQAKADELNQGVAEGRKDEFAGAGASFDPTVGGTIGGLVGDRYEPGDFDAMLARVRQLASAGELKTVWDPTRRTYRNMPTAQQPKDKK